MHREHEALAAEARIGKELGDRRQQHDQREPRVQRDEHGQHAGQGDGGLKQPERPVNHLQRPGRRLLLGLAQQVVGAGVFEERHVELAGLLHDLELHDLGDPLLQALL
jgi:hypothetical protein